MKGQKFVAPLLAVLSAASLYGSPTTAQDLYLRDTRGNVNQINTGIERSKQTGIDAEALQRSERTVNVSAFSRLVIRIPSEVVFKQGSPNRVELKAPPTVLRKIKTSQNGNTLTIESRGGFQSSGRVKITITGSRLEDVDLNGAIKADLQGLRGAKFRLRTTGTVDVTGRGEVSYCVLQISGASSADLRFLHCGVADLNVQGASDVHLHASDRVTGLVAGASDVTVSGRPGERKLTTSGAVGLSYD